MKEDQDQIKPIPPFLPAEDREVVSLDVDGRPNFVNLPVIRSTRVEKTQKDITREKREGRDKKKKVDSK